MLYSILFLVGRVLFGGYFVMAGYSHFKNTAMLVGYAQSKGMKQGKIAVLVSGVLLVAGGLGVLFGVAIQIAVACLILFLVPVSFIMHAYWKVTDPMAKMGDMVNFNKNMALVGAALMLLMLPMPWVWNLF
jgi:uncharacterized membrane protein YphA (DoxX/SURF4 family)